MPFWAWRECVKKTRRIHSPFPHLGQTSNIKFPPCSKHFYKAGIPTPKIPSPCKMHLCGHTPYNARSAPFLPERRNSLFPSHTAQMQDIIPCQSPSCAARAKHPSQRFPPCLFHALAPCGAHYRGQKGSYQSPIRGIRKMGRGIFTVWIVT